MKLCIPLVALLAFTSLAAEPISTNSNRRYKIVVAPQGDHEPTVFKLDTATGETWLYVRYLDGQHRPRWVKMPDHADGGAVKK